MTWSYAQDIDNATVQDDGKLALTTDFGTRCFLEGGLDVDNAASQSVLGDHQILLSEDQWLTLGT